MKNKKNVIIFLSGIICVLLAVIFIKIKLGPNKKMVDLNSYYNIQNDNEVAVICGTDKEFMRGILIDNEVYIDVNLVSQYIDKRFYYQPEENKVLYTEAAQTAEITSPSVILQGDTPYISVSMISQYSKYPFKEYDSGTLRRVWIWDYNLDSIDYAVTKEDTVIRYGSSQRSRIVQNIAADKRVLILGETKKWYEVMSEDGFYGYIRKNQVNEIITAKLDVVSREFPSNSVEGKVCLGWHQVTNSAANNNLAELLANTKGMNVVSPTWFSIVDNEGNISSLANQEYVDYAHSNSVSVWGLVDNFSDDIDIKTILNTYKSRRNLINKLIEQAVNYKLDGINIDFEKLKSDAALDYLQFLRELSVECRNNSLILSVDNYVPTATNTFYDREEQGLVVDYIIIMGYDEYWAGSESPGPTASLPFVENGIVNTLKEVPAKKVVNAIPFYTRLWKETIVDTDESGAETAESYASNSTLEQNVTFTSEARGINSLQALIDEKKISLTWLDDMSLYYGEYTQENSLYRFWFENKETIEKKLKVMKDNNIAGVACWRLGLEPTDVWSVIDSYLKGEN